MSCGGPVTSTREGLQRLRASLEPVLVDVHRTTPLSLVAEVAGFEDRPGWCVHLAGESAEEPVHRGYQPWNGQVFIDVPREWKGLCEASTRISLEMEWLDATANCAEAVQDLVAIELWHQGFEPTWPPCPSAVHRTPMRPQGPPYPPPNHGPVRSYWRCQGGDCRVRVGALGDYKSSW